MAEEDDFYTVVGVVGTIKHNDLTIGPSEHVGAYYIPYRLNAFSGLGLAIDAAGDPLALTGAVRQAITRLDTELPMFDVETMEARIGDSLTGRRASMFLLLAFAGVALFLAVIGIYGVLAYAVVQRKRELGIRMALGSSTREIFLLMLRHGARVTGIGLAIGGLGALVTGRLMESLLFGVQPLDAGVVGSVAAILGVVALAASVLPALQASRVDPVRALVGE
jgi:ABC-type antimicrobial peptide transport system permease subunit